MVKWKKKLPSKDILGAKSINEETIYSKRVRKFPYNLNKCFQVIDIYFGPNLVIA